MDRDPTSATAIPPGADERSPARGNRRITLRTALIGLAIALVLPLAGAAGFIIWVLEREHRERVAAQMLAEASALAAALEVKVATARSALDVLGTVPEIDAAQFATLHDLARQFVASRDAGLNLVLFGQDGQQLLNTLRDYGTELPNAFKEEAPSRAVAVGALPRTSTPWIQQAFATNAPVLSDVFMGVVAQQPLVALHVPVTRDGRVKYVWSYAFSPAGLQRLLAPREKGAGWQAVVLDRNGVIVARHPDHELFVDQFAEARLRAAAAENVLGFQSDVTPAGVPTYRAHVRTAEGWTVVLIRPASAVDVLGRQAELWWTISWVTFLAVALAVMMWFGRELARPLQRLSEAAPQLQEGRVPSVQTRLAEVAAVCDAFTRAAALHKTGTRLALLEGLIRHSPVGIALFDRSLRLVQANDQTSILGSEAERWGVGRSAPEALGKLGQDIQVHLMAVVQTGAAICGVEICGEIASTRGRRRWWLADFFPVMDAAGQLTHVGAVCLEITGRKEAEAAAQRALTQTRYLVENTPLAVVEWDAQFAVTVWNRRAEELFGWNADEVVGQHLTAFPIVYEDDVASVSAVMRELERPDMRYVFSSNRNRTKDGRVLHCEWYNSVLHDDAGHILAVFSLVLDVTERVRTERQLREADRRKDVYLATLAHELRNPLAPIRNAASVLRRIDSQDTRVSWASELIERQAGQMARLLDDLLDMARVTQGKLHLRTAPMLLADAVRDAVETTAPEIAARRHCLRVSVVDEAVWVEGDAVRLSQVFANLLTNAAKYTEPGGRIEVALTTQAEHAVVSVQDDGIGIEPGQQEQLFEPFAQSDRAVGVSRAGLGIGLALVKGIVESHAGTVCVRSDGVGRGARFEVQLPLCSPPLLAGTRPPAASAVLPPGMRILIADDNQDAANSLAQLLRTAGAQVETVYDGVAALQSLRRSRYDAAILDIGMPRHSGYEVARALSVGDDRPALIAVTGWGQHADRAAARAAGFDHHFTKPVSDGAIISALREIALQGAPPAAQRSS